MKRDLVVDKIVSYVRTNFVTDSKIVLPLDRSLLEAGLLDSYAIIELITHLESEFEIRIPEGDLTREKIGSIYKMADYVMAAKGLQRS